MDGRRDDLGSTWMLRNMRKNQAQDTLDDEKEDFKGKNDNSEKSDKNSKKNKDQEREQGQESAAEGEREPAPKREKTKLEGDDRLRVLAYSDSDSDVESHVQRVKDHLLPPSPETETEPKDDVGAEAEVVVEETVPRTASSRALSGLANVVGGAIGAAVRTMTPGIIFRVAALMSIQAVNPQAGQAAQVAASVLGVVGLVAGRQATRSGVPLPPRGETLQFEAVSLGKAAGALLAARLLRHAHHRLAERRILRFSSGVNVSALDEAVPYDPDKPPENAAEWAAIYRPEMREMRRMIIECGLELPPRFSETNAELLRFARACGLLEAETPEDRGKVLERAVRRVINTCEWLASQEPLSDVKMGRWERLVAWRGADASGCPILLIRLGRALQLCTRPGRLERFAAAIAAQVAAGVDTRLSDDKEGHEHIVAVVDCRETSNWEALMRSRDATSLAKRLAMELAANYPGRLEKVYLLEVPLLAKVALQSVIAPLAQSTRDKIVPASATDESLPITMALLQKRRSYARGLGRAMSDISLATSDASTPRGGHGDRDTDEEAEEEADGIEAVVTKHQQEEETEDQEDWISVAPVLTSSLGVPATQVRDGTFPRDQVEKADVPAEDSLSTADVATNLLEALEEAAREDVTSVPGTAGAYAAPASHTLPRTPSMMSLSPQTTEGSESFQEMMSAGSGSLPPSPTGPPPPFGNGLPSKAMYDTAAGDGTAADSPGITGIYLINSGTGSNTVSGGPPTSPWLGLASMFNNMFPTAAASGSRSSSGGGPSSSSGSKRAWGTPRFKSLRAHRLPPSLCAETSLSSLPETPVEKKKGGLMDLPPRPSTTRKTPAKPSLRRTESWEAPRSAGPLGSFPLRRQSSVSWAETLERVREIEATPDASPAPSSVMASPVATAMPDVVTSASFPSMVVLLMCAGLLQRLLLGM